jgi:hypothetical protein
VEISYISLAKPKQKCTSYTVNAVSSDLVVDPGCFIGTKDYAVLHSPRIPSRASRDYPSKVTPENLL